MNSLSDMQKKEYEMILHLYGNHIFEVDLKQYKFSDSPDGIKKIPCEKFMKEVMNCKSIHPNDDDIFWDFFKKLSAGETRYTEEVRFEENNNYEYFLMNGCAILDQNGKAVRIFGTRTNINEQKKETSRLMEKAEHDLLTGLYNKTTTGKLIGEKIKDAREESHALFMADVDNFKMINDKLGHLFGDAVLGKLGTRLKQIFSADDVVGRVGGDEFVVYLNKVNSPEDISNAAQKITDAFRQAFKEQKVECSVSGSVGVAVYPQDGAKYNELLKCADVALYHAKNKGKNCYQFYQKNLKQEQMLSRIDTVGREKGNGDTSAENISDYIFEILYDSKDIIEAVSYILELIGRFYNVSRCYVFENSEDGLYCHNTFEWCNSGITPQIDRLQRVPYNELGGYYNNFDENDIFYCADITMLQPEVYQILEYQGIHSILQCAIRENGMFKGYVGFDECSGKRLWTKMEITTLTLVAKILSTFLVKERTQKRLDESYRLTKNILEKQNAWTYVIEKDTFRLLYTNKKTRDIAPEVKLMDPCYRILMCNEEQCEFCPIRKINENDQCVTEEIYNPAFKLWISTTISPIQWHSGTEAYLVTCFDISKFKQK